MTTSIGAGTLACGATTDEVRSSATLESTANNPACATAEISSTRAARIRHCDSRPGCEVARIARLGRAPEYPRIVRFVLRIVGSIAVLLAIPVAAAAGFGRIGALAGSGLSVLALLWLWLWLPRSAHDAFESGKYTAAARRYRLLSGLAPSAARERAALLSRTGCYVAEGNLASAERLLAMIDGDALAVGERAVWLNNRACASLAAGRDPHAALALVDEASELRPDVPAVQHTRGMALLAVGRVDDAIAVLDGMRSAGELPPRLETERCRDLARAWTQKGETAYADDYRLRADALAR